MIEKMTSHELNEILDKSNTKINKVLSEVKTAKEDISDRLKIMRFESEYIEQQMELLKTMKCNSTNQIAKGQTIKKFCSLNNPDLSNKYEHFGSTVNAKFKRIPINILNILSTSTSDAFYRDIADVYVNGISKEEYKGIFMHDSISSKKIFFNEMLNDDGCVINIEVDPSKTLGTSKFNMIELDTFLSGSYDIEYIRIYKENNEYDEYSNYHNVGKMRIQLDESYIFRRVEIKIIPKFSTQVNGIDNYLVGIKHIYFYDCKFESNSYAIAIINSDDYIDTIYNKVKIKTSNGDIETTLKDQGIEIYADCIYDNTTKQYILSSKQEPSGPDEVRAISMNIKHLYAKVPLCKKSIIGATFDISTKII